MDTYAGLSFCELLRDCRLAAGLTQEALADRAGISERNIRALERGGSKLKRKPRGAWPLSWIWWATNVLGS